MFKKSKRLFAVLCAFIVFASTYANYIIPFQVNAVESTTAPILDLENDVKYFGRTFAENGTHYFSWSNSGFQFTFYGTGATATLKATLHTAGSTAQTAYIKIYVDGVLTQDIAVPETQTSITLASGLEKGTHTIKVIKRTSGYYSIVGLSKIQLAAGSEIRETQKYFERKMLFIGDNLTAGYASAVTERTTTDPGTAKEDSTISYTALTAEYFGAENMTVALTHSGGRGIVSNGNKTTTHMAPAFFEYLEYRQKQSVNYDHAQYDPDIIVINLGSYDKASANVTDANFKTGCKNFILQVRKAYPDAKILYTYGITESSYSSIISSVISELNKGGDNKIYFKSLTTLAASEKGYNDHPLMSVHASRSKELIAAVEDIMGWTGANTPGNPVSSEVPVDTLYQPFEQTDISVMSYNVLSHNSSSQNYEAYGNRMAKVAKMIKAYDPDIIGLQEVSRPYDTYTHDWPGYLSSNCTEYASVRLDTQANNSNLMRIGNGLMIMYKKDRFDLVTSGYQQYKTYTETNSSYGSKTYTVTDTSRWFHWVQLKDKTTGQVFYLYNTHLTVNGSTPVADRVSQCRILAQHIVKTNGASSCPFFITGDFNTTLDAGDGALDKLINYNKKDDGASAIALFNDGASVADYTRFSDRGGSLDHVFVANRYIDVKEFHVAVEGVNGRRTSDHSPHIAYCNFKPHTTAGLTTGLDESGKVFTASTSSSSYTFNFTLGTGVSYSIYDETGNALSGTTVSLSKRTNRFGLYFKDGKGNPVCTIQAVITNTSVAQPTLTTNALNSYFANGAYHVLSNESSLNISASSGSFYTNPYASRGATTSLTLAAVPAGRTVYYLKTSAGDIFPVYIYKQTSTANTAGSVFYVDDDTLGASGTVAFYDGKDVIFAEAGTKIYSTVEAVAAKTNTVNGATVYFAPGKYVSANVKFTKNVTLLGNNYDISAVDRKNPNWSLAGRKAETIINGGFVFENSSNISVTVKGFTIRGTSTNGSMYFNDSTSTVSTRATHVQTLDIQNNILTGGGNGSSSSYVSVVHAYSGAQIKGLIKNNYFRSTLNQEALGDKGKTRAIAAKNANGLLADSNYFIGYSILFDFTDEVSTSVAGNSVYTILRNRMEHCGTARNYIKGITSNTSANISYLDNDFVRCSGSHSVYAIYFNFNQNSLGNNCSRININIIGNRFADCYRSLQFTRSSAAAQTGNLAQATVRVNKNSFINPTEGKWTKYFRSIDLSFCVVGATANGTISPEKWNFAANHFESTFLVTEYNNLQNYYDNNIYELNYIRYYSTQSAGSDSKSFIISADHFKPVSTTTATSASNAFIGATGATSDSFTYDFNEDVKNMQFIKGVSPFKEKFTHAVGNSSSHISITNELALRMDGFAQFYSDNRWTGENQITLDLKMDSYANNFAGFYIKYGKENVSGKGNNIVFFENDGVRGDSANSTTGTTGIGFSFRTINNTPCIEVFVKYLNNSGKLAVSGQYFYNVVDNLNDFNTYKIADDGSGTIKLYANGKLFATLVCSNAKVPTLNTSYKETYYSNVTIKDGNGSTLSTVSNALVSTESALAFGTRNENIEIDNVEISNKISGELQIDAVMLTLTNNISVNYAVIKEKFDTAGFKNPQLKVVFEGTSYNLQPTLTSISNIPCYVFNFDDIAPQMMNDILSATLYAEFEGEIHESATSNYSVAMYAYDQLQATTNAKFRTLLVDMLKYGRAAQEQTGYKTYNPIDGALTDTQASWGTQTLRTFVDASSKPTTSGIATWLGMGLNLQNKVELIGYFDIPDKNGVIVKVTNSNGNLIDTITADEFGTATGPNGTPVVSFTFDSLAANQMSDVLGFTVYNTEGIDISGKYLFSVESYVKKSQTNTNAKFINLINAMMMYGDSARAFASN